MYDTEPTSGFIKPTDIIDGECFTDYMPLASNGPWQLTRARRQGRWWMLKGLKEPFRQDSAYRAFLQKEYEIVSQLQHPMVVSVFSLEEVSGLGLCIVMEWIEGTTLRTWLAAGFHSESQRRHVADMLTEAVAYVHSRQTQHRDLKPTNIMLTHDGRHLKLIDFGLSDTDSHAVLKTPAGTAGYMAPEGPADIYALGCIFRDLHLGWTSRWVIRKCQAPLPVRYTDVLDVQRDLHRCWVLPRRVVATILALLAAICLYLLGAQTTRQHTRVAMQQLGDSLVIVRQESEAKTATMQATTDSLQLRLKTMEGLQQTMRNEQQRREQIIHAAIQKIDERAKASGVEQMFDTLTCQRYAQVPFIRIVNELMQFAAEEAAKVGSDEAERLAVKTTLQQYVQEHYSRRWNRLMFSLPYD